VDVSRPLYLLNEGLAFFILVFASAAVALYAIGHHGLGIGFAVVAFVNTAVATAGRASRERDHQPVADGGEA
jgi:hypothetical protein